MVPTAAFFSKLVFYAFFYVKLASCKSDEYVRSLNPDILAEVTSSSVPVAIRVDPVGCERVPGTCNMYNEFWDSVASVFPKRVFRLSCAQQKDMCLKGDLIPVEISEPREPIFAFWVDGEFVHYDETRNPDDILEYIVEEVFPRSARKGGKDIIVAFEAAEKYNANIATHSKAEMFFQGQQFEKAMPILIEHIDKFPDNLNSVVLTANLAGAVKKSDYALELMKRVEEKEPNNAFILGRTAQILHSMKNWDMAMEYISRALSVEPDSEDADEMNRKNLEDLRMVCTFEKKKANYVEPVGEL